MPCKLCGAESGGAAPCPSCGFDSSLDYEKYPTLATIDTAPSLAARRAEWEQRGCRVVRCPSCGKTAFAVLLEPAELSCLGCGRSFSLWAAVPPDGRRPDEDGGAEAEPFSWQFDESSGTLTVRGTGPMPEKLPDEWKSYRDMIRSVEVLEGVTTLAPTA